MSYSPVDALAHFALDNNVNDVRLNPAIYVKRA